MKTKQPFSSIVFFIALVVYAIMPFGDNRSFGYEWSKTIGFSGPESGYSVQQTDDGGYIIVGYTQSIGAGYSDVYLVKTDALGNEIWSKKYRKGPRHTSNYGRSMQQTDDGGYIIIGSTEPPGSIESDVYLLKIDALGNELWSKTYGGRANDVGDSVQQTSDGGYIIVGCKEDYGTWTKNVYLIKTDSDGNLQWSNTFGGSSHDEGYSVLQTGDGGFIITGRTMSYGAGGGLMVI